LITEGKFSNLTSVPFIPFDEHVIDMYIKKKFTLKSRITEVHLIDNNEVRGTYLDLCDKLYQFPNLQSVFIDQSFDTSSRNIMDYVGSITVHSNLIHLEKLRLRLAKHNCLRLPFKELQNIQPSTKIKGVSITVKSWKNCDAPNEQFMLYMMKKFPNPSRFRLFNSRRTPSVKANEQNQEYTTIILHFLQYLCKIHDCDFSNYILADGNTASLIKYLFS
jgi:hypothetical protein